MERADIFAALRDVEDPEFQVSIVDMGLIVDARQEGSRIDVALTFTAMGCPATEMIIDDIHDRLLQEPGVSNVKIDVVWDPIWTAERLTSDGRLAFQEMGIAV